MLVRIVAMLTKLLMRFDPEQYRVHQSAAGLESLLRNFPEIERASGRNTAHISTKNTSGIRRARHTVPYWKTEIVLRRSKIFIVIGIQIALSSVGAAYYGQHPRSVPAALELSSAGYEILLLGGMVRNKSLALLGRETLRIIERYRGDKAFLGSTGFTAEMGHSTPNPDDAQIKEALIRIADEAYVLVDSSKYGHNCLTSFAQLRDVHLTITDSGLPRAKAKTLEAVGAKLRIAEVVDKADLNRKTAGALDVSTAIETPFGNNQMPLRRKGKR
jgi:hypothetical protein